MLHAWTFAKCAPSDKGLFLQTLLLRGKDIYTLGFSSSPSSVDGAPRWSSWRAWLTCKVWERFPYLERQRNMAGYATLICMWYLELSAVCLSLKFWELFQPGSFLFISPSPVPRELFLRSVCYSEVTECRLILSDKKLRLGKKNTYIYPFFFPTRIYAPRIKLSQWLTAELCTFSEVARILCSAQDLTGREHSVRECGWLAG